MAPSPAPQLPASALVVGPHGFLAGHLVARLQAAGVRISGAGRRPETPGHLSRYLPVQFSAPDAVARLAGFIRGETPDWIFHLAGTPCRTASDAVAANVSPAAALLDAVAAAAPVASVVVVGSAAEYGAPIEPGASVTESQPCAPQTLYGATKLAQTHLSLEAARRGVCVTVARPFNLIGPGISPAFFPGAIVQRAREAIACGAAEIEVGNVETERDFVSVEDTVDALILIAAARRSGSIFNVCSGEPTRMRTLLEAMLARLPRSLGYHVNPALVRITDTPRVIGSAVKLERELGWHRQISLANSLSATVDHAFRSTP